MEVRGFNVTTERLLARPVAGGGGWREEGGEVVEVVVGVCCSSPDDDCFAPETVTIWFPRRGAMTPSAGRVGDEPPSGEEAPVNEKSGEGESLNLEAEE